MATDCHNQDNKWTTAYIASKSKYSSGYFETSLKIADIPGVNNAFWVTTDDNYEIDPSEIHYPNMDGVGVHYWPPPHSGGKATAI